MESLQPLGALKAMTLREAAQRTGRSITTLRRYIRSGRLAADKRQGRFGPEYFVFEQDLIRGGLQAEAAEQSLARASPVEPLPLGAAAIERIFRESVPLSLFQELQMKHEQLLAQYGMVRAAGLRSMELQGRVDAEHRERETAAAQAALAGEQLLRETSELRRRLREAELELEGRSLTIAALREKVRALEMLTRNAVMTETIEKQFGDVMAQARRVEQMAEAAMPPETHEPDH